MKLFLILLTGLLLSGCGQKPPLQAYADHQLFEGYPCGDTCDEFSKGFEAAQSAGFTSGDQCGEGFDSATMGCKVYVTEFEIEQKEYEDIMEDFNAQFEGKS